MPTVSNVMIQCEHCGKLFSPPIDSGAALNAALSGIPQQCPHCKHTTTPTKESIRYKIGNENR